MSFLHYLSILTLSLSDEDEIFQAFSSQQEDISALEHASSRVSITPLPLHLSIQEISQPRRLSPSSRIETFSAEYFFSSRFFFCSREYWHWCFFGIHRCHSPIFPHWLIHDIITRDYHRLSSSSSLSLYRATIFFFNITTPYATCLSHYFHYHYWAPPDCHCRWHYFIYITIFILIFLRRFIWWDIFWWATILAAIHRTHTLIIYFLHYATARHEYCRILMPSFSAFSHTPPSERSWLSEIYTAIFQTCRAATYRDTPLVAEAMPILDTPLMPPLFRHTPFTPSGRYIALFHIFDYRAADTLLFSSNTKASLIGCREYFQSFLRYTGWELFEMLLYIYTPADIIDAAFRWLRHDAASTTYSWMTLRHICAACLNIEYAAMIDDETLWWAAAFSFLSFRHYAAQSAFLRIARHDAIRRFSFDIFIFIMRHYLHYHFHAFHAARPLRYLFSFERRAPCRFVVFFIIDRCRYFSAL